MKQFSASAAINVWGNATQPIDERKLSQIRNELIETLSSAVDECFERHGLSNEQVHSCFVDEIEDTSE